MSAKNLPRTVCGSISAATILKNFQIGHYCDFGGKRSARMRCMIKWQTEFWSEKLSAFEPGLSQPLDKASSESHATKKVI